MDDMTLDFVQLIAWTVIGLFVTWGILLAFVGFRGTPAYNKKRTHRIASYAAVFLGVFWLLLWVGAVIFNILEILGAPVWLIH